MDTFYIIPHSHWEGAVFTTREGYLHETGPSIVLTALHLLAKHPSYRFIFDQVCLVKPFLERYPEQAATFRRFVDEGRLEIVGGLLVMPDVNMPSGESFVRQVLVGKRWFRETLGVDVSISWQLDTFGHHAQMPQILRQSGYTSMWTQRGGPDLGLPVDLTWEGIDGSTIPLYWLSKGYGMLYPTPSSFPEFSRLVNEKYAELIAHGPGRVQFGFNGFDVAMPEEHIPGLVEEFNSHEDETIRLQIAVPSDYESASGERGMERPTVRGDLNPIFQGVYSSHIDIKQATRKVEQTLTAAEKLGAVLLALGEETDNADLEEAWDPSLFNQAHDVMSGVMLDHVYDDTMKGFEFSLRLGRVVLMRRLAMLAERIDTRGDGAPVVVFNPTGWARTDAVEVDVAFDCADARVPSVVGPDGEEIPVQILESRHTDDGSLLRARIAFVARDVPAFGHSVYRVLPAESSTASGGPAPDCGDGILSNDRYRVTVDPATGAITGISVKDGDWEALAGPANVVAQEEDTGDYWELHGKLPKGFATYTVPHGLPEPGSACLSTDQPGTPGSVTRGPVFDEITVRHPFAGKGSFQTTIRLYAELSRIEIRTWITNRDRYVRYRMMAPIAVREGLNVHEIPFGAIERPDEVELPAQTWVDRGDGSRGVALLNRGLPGNNCVDGTLLLSLLRSTCIYIKGSDEYVPDGCHEMGFKEGKCLDFEYALVPHSSDWREAGIVREGQAYNHPLLACAAGVHSGELPPRWGLIDVRHPNVVVSAIKPGEDGGVIVRMYEATGQPAEDVEIVSALPIESVEEVNLVEDPIGPVQSTGNTLRVDLKPFEIRTLRLELGAS
ncbi:MAG: hypothetical protein HQ559_07580 [Lentisphaerae bacterium]|nr:hypothetical protein [Lentisphaerota bacterium]